MYNYVSVADLAGDVCFNPTFLQTKTRIHHLIDTYLTLDILGDRLEDLPEQFLNPQPRPWQPIEWQSINSEQILGIDLKAFLGIIKGALDTEAPIRGYTQTSRQYLQPIHPAMARFVGGVVADDRSLLELGLWEKEERQHTPALARVYQQLTQQKIISDSRSPKTYRSDGNAKMDLYRHGIHRIATEYSAVCLYLWMMARTTGSLQQVLKELLQDEINHLTKFWGFGKWLYSDFNLSFSTVISNKQSTQHINRAQAVKHLTVTLTRMMRVLHWKSWSLTHKVELIYTFILVWQQMWSWSNSLTPEYLAVLFDSSLIADNDALKTSFTSA
ncbi:conserved hypothetical protein [Hyella patelloides LEGE 07179]|uniref:Ferritin-like domain-containing protein n=1 Tax=Hyella patelloides LEGE 07179 TaxID=945734 RepID=A0A563W068_9CYAN|nr:ferritin-like domain-containing protein [Hyella patelloides]VEP17108.1 conserved hypothetical protein [Hyella patelloides LEGE 07179]